MSWSEDLISITLFVVGYLVGPTALVWGWASFFLHRHERWRPVYALSGVGLVLASLSAALGLFMILYASSGAFYNFAHMELFYRFIAYGAAFSTLGFLFSIAGVWKSHSLRWQAPLGAMGTLAFWLIATTWP